MRDLSREISSLICYLILSSRLGRVDKISYSQCKDAASVSWTLSLPSTFKT